MYYCFVKYSIIIKSDGGRNGMYKVILVDDEILVRQAIGENIDWSSLGYELVTDCQNGKEAIEYLQDNPVDLVLTDINMPYVDGLELSKYIHENYPGTIVVIFSGYSEFDYAKKAIQYNVAEYLLKPVTPRELITVLGDLKTKLDEKQSDERKRKKLEEVYTSYTRNESAIIANELSGLVQGTQEPAICIHNLEKHGIQLVGAYFRVVVMDIDVFSNGIKYNVYEKKESALMSFVVGNISEEIVSREQCGVVYRDNVGRVCILFYTNKPREFGMKIPEIIEEIRVNIYDSMKLTISVGVGGYVQEIDRLFESYEDASLMKKYQFVKGENSYFDYEKVKADLDNTVDISDYLKMISGALISEEENEFPVLCQEIKEKIGKLYIDENKAVSYLYQIVMQIYTMKLELSGESEKDIRNREMVMGRISEAYSLEKAMAIIVDYGEEILEQLIAMRNPSGKKQALLALTYINEHFSDKDLGLSTICSYLGISTSHFSNIYKEVTGETFMESLTRVRMEKAKQLLIETNLKNYEIADRVGFSDPHYFSIAFKKATGKTPKEYTKENS